MASKENLYNYRFILIIFLLVCFDIFSKVIVNNSLLFGQSVETVFPFIELLLIFNSGIAFGIFDNKGELASNLLLIVTILITLYLLWMIIYETKDRNKLALSFITGGAIGNVLDRINDGSVTDFLHLKIYNYSLFVFNLADAFITIGAILIIYFEFKDYLK
jgi:lipoprotein signal peptidase